MIRPAIQDDIPAITRIMLSEPGLWQDGWRDGVVEQGLRSSQGLAFVWEENGRVLGFVCAHPSGGTNQTSSSCAST